MILVWDERPVGEEAQALLSPQAPRSDGDHSDFCNSLFAACAGCGISTVYPTKVGILSLVLPLMQGEVAHG